MRHDAASPEPTEMARESARRPAVADREPHPSARAVNALAYTVGSSIVFGQGLYSPHNSEGCDLLAHELVHTIQQGRGSAQMGGPLRIDAPDSPAEVEARSIAAARSSAADERGERPDLDVADGGPRATLLRGLLGAAPTSDVDPPTRSTADRFEGWELQRSHGNAAVSRMMTRRLLQRTEYGKGEVGHRPNLVQGDTGEGVTLLQRLLGVKESGVFDGGTRTATDRFQSQCAWAPSGVGPMTWYYLERHEGAIGVRPNLSTGDRGPGVKLLQRVLGVAQTSVLDQATRKAVDAFQRGQGWEPSGVGPQTWAKLDALGLQDKSFEFEINPDGTMSLDQDPRKSSRYIDNRVEAVGWGLYVGVLDGEVGSFLVWCSGLSDPIRLPWRYTSFDPGPRTPVGKEGHGNALYDSHEQAAAAAPDLGHEVAFFPTAGGMTAPTIFSPLTAPRVMQSAKTAFEQTIAQVEEELIIVTIGLVGTMVGRIAYSRVNRIGKGGPPKPKAGEEPPPPKQQEGPGPAVPRAGRPRLTVAQIGALDPHEYVTFRTRDEAVARNATLEPRGMANPLVTDDICFQDGLEGLNYGEWHVSFKKGEVPGLREAGPSFPGEWRTAQQVEPDKGVWYHHDDWRAAKGK